MWIERTINDFYCFSSQEYQSYATNKSGRNSAWNQSATLTKTDLMRSEIRNG